MLVAALAMTLAGAVGCRLPFSSANNTAPAPMLENPLFIATPDHEFLWSQVVDTLDNYFRIGREERVRQIGAIMTEGRLETIPTVGSTIFEPWRSDSSPGYERLHATLQSIRRRASVRVTPTEGGYLVGVEVHKELEDLNRAENASVGQATYRHDGTLVNPNVGEPVRPGVVSTDGPITLGWIPLGRDPTLEQRILAEILGRMTDLQPAFPSNAH